MKLFLVWWQHLKGERQQDLRFHSRCWLWSVEIGRNYSLRYVQIEGNGRLRFNLTYFSPVATICQKRVSSYLIVNHIVCILFMPSQSGLQSRCACGLVRAPPGPPRLSQLLPPSHGRAQRPCAYLCTRVQGSSR